MFTTSLSPTDPWRTLLILSRMVSPAPRCKAFATQLSDADIAAAVTFERNGFGHQGGEVVQPSQVKVLCK